LALIAFNKALELDGGNVDYILLTADLYLHLGSLVEARDLARKALELSPMSKIAKKILKDAEEKERGEAVV
jgi:tetratricopeptide (TPR) repeat protein